MLSKLRKYGLQHCDLPTMLDNMSVLLRVVTLNIDSRFTKKTSKLAYLLNAIGMSCYYYVYLWSMLWFIFVRCRETGDIVAAMVVFSLGTSSEIGMSKLIFMYFYNDTVKGIVDRLLACDAEIDPNSRFSRNILITLRDIKKRALVFWLVINGNGVVYVLKAMITPGRHLMEDIFTLHGLEPMFESPNYEIAFICCAIGDFFTCYPAANITAFLIVTIGYTEAQMLALSKELHCLWEDAIEHRRATAQSYDTSSNFDTQETAILNQFVKIKLRSIVMSHTNNLYLVKEIESVYRGAIAVEFFLLVVGLIAELLGGLENTYLLVPFAIMQVAMDCLTGQRLIEANITFCNAVYSCGWENFDKANRKTVLLMLYVSQKNMTISAGGIAILNYECLMFVLRSIYSAYTTLRTTMSKPTPKESYSACSMYTE